MSDASDAAGMTYEDFEGLVLELQDIHECAVMDRLSTKRGWTADQLRKSEAFILRQALRNACAGLIVALTEDRDK